MGAAYPAKVASSQPWITTRPACLANIRRGRRKAPPKTKGFDAIDKAPIVESTESIGSPNLEPKNKRIYSMPGLYDLAFGYRNYDEEVDFLLDQHGQLNGGRPPQCTLELAAGPARHTITALQSGRIQRGMALDNSPEMVAYGKEVAQAELDVDSMESFHYLQADMTKFELPKTNTKEDTAGVVDSAWILLGSLQHLTENDQVLSCFQSVHKAMRQDGTLILELPHPRETFSLVECTRNGWEVPLEDEDGQESGELKIVWGDDNDDFDPIRQVRQFTVAMEVEDGTKDSSKTILQSVKEIVPLRLFTAQEIDLLAKMAGFRVASMHGALCEGVDVNDEDEAFRLVCVLQKI